MSLDLASHAASKLEPFVLMSKSAKGAAAAKLIQDATSAPGVFVFAELLDMPNIKELEALSQEKSLALLRLFSYGTYDEYISKSNHCCANFVLTLQLSFRTEGRVPAT